MDIDPNDSQSRDVDAFVRRAFEPAPHAVARVVASAAADAPPTRYHARPNIRALIAVSALLLAILAVAGPLWFGAPKPDGSSTVRIVTSEGDVMVVVKAGEDPIALAGRGAGAQESTQRNSGTASIVLLGEPR